MESSQSSNCPTPRPGELSQRSSWSRSNLTLSQWLLWYEQRRPLYTLSPLAAAFTFHDSLDTRNFRQAFQSVVERSDTLRTVFVEDDGLPQRYVLPRLPLAMDIVDLSAAYQPAVAYAQWMAERDLRPLSPTLRPFDSTLLRLGDRHFVWRLALHRLIADSHSLLLVYRYTAEAYAAAVDDRVDALRPLPSFDDFARYDRKQVDNSALQEARSSSRTHGRFSQVLPVPCERNVLELGAERSILLRRIAAELAGDAGDDSSAVFLLFAATLAALLARVRRCQTVCIDTDLDMRHLGPWQDAIGRISRVHTLSVEDAQNQSLRGLVGRLGRELAKAQQGIQVAPSAERLTRACRALLQVDDMVFPPFAGCEVTVERLDTCYSRHKPGERRETRIEPSICLRIDDYSGRDNLKAVFTFCSGHAITERSPQLAQEYLRLLDALLSAREQPIRSLRWAH